MLVVIMCEPSRCQCDQGRVQSGVCKQSSGSKPLGAGAKMVLFLGQVDVDEWSRFECTANLQIKADLDQTDMCSRCTANL